MAIVISGTTGIDAGSLPAANIGKISAGAGLPTIINTAGVEIPEDVSVKRAEARLVA